MTAISIHPALRPWLVAISYDAGSSTEPYRVLPGPYPVIGFQQRGGIGVLRDGRRRGLSRAGITGLLPEARWFAAEPDTASVLIRLKPAAAVAFFGVDMRELSDAHVELDSLAGDGTVREASEIMADARTIAETGDAVQRLFLRLLDAQKRRPHPAVETASARLIASGGNARIDCLADAAGISSRQLERLFHAQIGTGPKEFASLCRFQSVVRRLGRENDWAGLALEAGYADQAHLIRSFAKRAGETPTRFAAGMRCHEAI